MRLPPARLAFDLKAFHADPSRVVHGFVSTNKESLTIIYIVGNKISDLEIDLSPDEPESRNPLWQHTCFELFLTGKVDHKYIEFNFAPSRCWASYYFSDYRRPLEDGARFREMIIPQISFEIADESRVLLSARLSLDPIRNFLGLAHLDELQLGIASIMKCRSKRMEYWALNHVKNEPDFHRRESFTLCITL